MDNMRKCGILLHPTSLPSAYGIGDLGKGALDFIDFLHRGNQKIWQTLPIGPTSFGDSPYQSFSAFAGNFYLISPDILVTEGLLCQKDVLNIPNFSTTKVEYGNVIDYKTKLFKQAFSNFKPNKAFKTFCTENEFWLEDYSLFSALKDYYIEKRQLEYESKEFKAFCSKTKSIMPENLQKDYYYGGVWSTWDKDLVSRVPAALKAMRTQLSKPIEYYKFLQYKFFQQWTAVKTYANNNQIEIIGDIPIFVAYDSSDVWANQHLFKLNSKSFPTEVAGVPPDYFSQTGQLWGNPLYNWTEHKKDGYSWWINRIKSLLSNADIIRIDHFRGFESNYCIPFQNDDATVGTWKKGPGKKLFDAIKKEISILPIIAEDLGVITPEVIMLRESIKSPGMKILQFAFDNSENNTYLPHNFEKNCVVYTGTHDNDTSIGWYNSTSDDCRDYFRRYMNTDGASPQWDLIRLAIASCANIAIYPLQDVLGLDESARMNTPGIMANNWQWRFTSSMLKEEYSQNLFYLSKVFRR